MILPSSSFVQFHLDSLAQEQKPKVEEVVVVEDMGLEVVEDMGLELVEDMGLEVKDKLM